jgi:hypothetical protein
MQFREFHVRDDIRVCVYELDATSLPYHQHTHISDLTCCVYGAIRLEIPALGVDRTLPFGELVQVPSGQRHRCTNANPKNGNSRYVLMQVGEFDITFFDSNRPTPTENRIKPKPIALLANCSVEALTAANEWYRRTKDNGGLSSMDAEDIEQALRLIKSQANFY